MQTVNYNGSDGSKRKRKEYDGEEEAEKDSLRRTVLPVLKVFERFGARRVDGWVYIEKKTADGRGTGYYQPYLSIEDFVNTHCCDKVIQFDMWRRLLDKKVKSAILHYLSTTRNDCEFPLLFDERRPATPGVIAFENGTAYVGADFSFVSHEAKEAAGDRKIATSYIPQVLDCELIGCTDPMDIPTPVLDGILDRQGWSVEVKSMFFALCVGRILCTGAMDNWSMAPMLHGAHGTGASFLVSAIISRLCPSYRTYIARGDGRRCFSLADAHDRDLVLIDCNGQAGITFDEFMVMLNRESAVYRRLFETHSTKPWKALPLLFGSQIPDCPGYVLSLAARLVVFAFTEPLHYADLGNELDHELAAIVVKGARCYSKLVSACPQSTVGGVDRVWQFLPDYFRKTRKDIVEATDPVQSFLTSDLVVFPATDEDPKSYYVPERDLEAAFLRFCNSQGIARPALSSRLHTALRRFGCHYEPRAIKSYLRNAPSPMFAHKLECPFIVGLDVKQRQ